MSAIRSITAVLALCAAMPAFAQTARTGVTETVTFDAYIDQTFGGAFTRSGPTEMIAPNPANKLGAGEPSPFLRVKVVWKQRARLTEDMVLTPDSPLGGTLTKGTILYRATFRRAAEEAGTFEAWCGPFGFKWGINRDRPAWNMVCLQRMANGKTAFYFQPHLVVHYTNGTSKTAFHEQPPRYTSRLLEAHASDADFPKLEPISEAGDEMTLALFAERPFKDNPEGLFPTRAYWGLFTPPYPYFGGVKVRLEATRTEGSHLRIRMGEQALETDYDSVTRTYTAPQVTSVQDTDPQTASFAPTSEDPGYIPYYAASGATPAAGPEPAWRLGTLSLKPDTLKLTQGLVKKDTVLLTMEAVRSARLKIVDAPAPLNGVYQFLDGDHVYEWTRTGYQPDGTAYRERYFCGQGHMRSAINARRPGLCVPQSSLNVQGAAELKTWDISSRDRDYWQGMFNVGPHSYRTVADPDPTPERLTLQLLIDVGSDSRAELRVGTLVAGRFVESARLFPPYDKNGVARLYLWDNVLEIRREGKLFSGVLIDKTTGFGPYYE